MISAKELKVRFHSIWKIVPVPVISVSQMPGRLVGLCLGPLVLVRDDYASDWPTIIHELTHCKQFWRGFGILHLFRYYASRSYRLRTEVEAFRAELAVCPASERQQRLKDSARALATSYSLGLDTEACRLLLGSRQAFAHGSWTRATSMFMPDVVSSALPARSGYSRRVPERRRRARGNRSER